MSVVVFPASKPGQESPAGPEFGDCCGLRPILLTWSKAPYLVGVICQRPGCINSVRGVLAYDVDAVEKWGKYRNSEEPPFAMCYEITWENNPDILATGDILRYRSERAPTVGDTLIFEDHIVTITAVDPILDYPKHNWEVGIEGDEAPKIRELLTYEVMKRES